MAPHAHPPLTPFGSALAGALGSVFANAVVYPLDTVKTRLQALDDEELSLFDSDDQLSSTDVEKARSDDVSSSMTSPSKDKPKGQTQLIKRLIGRRLKHWSMLVLLLRILKTEGLAGAFHGFGASMLGTFSQQFAYFFFHTFLRTNYIKRLASRSSPSTAAGRLPSLSTGSELLLGALAGALAQIFTIPVNVIATRQQLWQPDSDDEPVQKGKGVNPHAPSLLETANEIITESGVTGLWTGLKPGLVLTVNPAITYGVFERLKTWKLQGAGPTAKLGVAEAFWLGVGSKTLATVVTYPYIFAKVRLQAKYIDDQHSPASVSSSAHSASPNANPAGSAQAPASAPVASYASVASVPPPSFGDTAIIAADSKPIDNPRPRITRHHSHHPHYKGAIELLTAIYKEKGLAGWYQGLGAQVIKAVLCQGITFVSKDQFESYAYLLIIFFTRLRARIGATL